MSRKNIHGKAGVRFKAGYTVSKDRNMLRNVSTDLIIYGKVEVTAKVASQLKTTVDHLITLAKRGDLHARRQAAAYVRDVWANKEETQTALQKLFDEIGPRYAERNGGYTRALKLGNRRGDNAPMCIVELV
jgi:large subunit ribosomal protein L17